MDVDYIIKQAVAATNSRIQINQSSFNNLVSSVTASSIQEIMRCYKQTTDSRCNTDQTKEQHDRQNPGEIAMERRGSCVQSHTHINLYTHTHPGAEIRTIDMYLL